MMLKRNTGILVMALTPFALLALASIFCGPQVGKADTPLANPSTSISIRSSSTFTTYLPVALRNYPPPPTVFGVQVHSLVDSSGFDRVDDVGAHWVRYSAFHWDVIEANQGVYNWTSVDEAGLQRAHERGFRVIATIQFTPLWAQKYNGSYCGPIKEDALDDFAAFLTALVKRYKDPPYSIKYWELGNEPDMPVWYNRSGYGCWIEGDDPISSGGYYAKMLKWAYPAIKAADPQAVILIGGLALVCDPDNPRPGWDCEASRFLEGILANGGGPYFDAVSFHAYAWYGGEPGMMVNLNWTGRENVHTTALVERVDFVRSALAEYGYEDEKLLFNTETALTCTEDTSDCRETQAMYAARAYAEAIALGLTGQTWFAMVNDGWYYTGLLQGSDLSPKPAYNAYRTASDYLSSAHYLSPVGYTGLEGYRFESADGRQVEVVWASDGITHALQIPSGASAYDRYGVLIASSGSVQVGYAPIYIVH